VSGAHELAEFLAAVLAAESETSAATAVVDGAAQALGADAAVIVCGGELVAAAGHPEGRPRLDELERVRPGDAGSRLHIQGVGIRAAAAVALEHPRGATLVVARQDPLERDEEGLLRAMARAASTRLRMLRVIGDERTAADELERFAGEQAALRRLATLVADVASPEEVFSAVAEELALLSRVDIVKVLRYEPDDCATVVGGWGDPEEHLPVGRRFVVAGDGVAVYVRRTGRPARAARVDGPRGSVAESLRRAGVLFASGGPILVGGRLWGVVIAALTGPGRPPQEPLTLESVVEDRITAFIELVATVIANALARAELRAVADEQAALRRVAISVARGAPPAEVFAAVAEEVGNLLVAADLALVSCYNPDRSFEVVGGWSRAGPTTFVGERMDVGGHNVTTLVFERGEPARVDDLTDDPDAALNADARDVGVRSSAGAPISVEGRIWGVMIVASTHEHGLPAGIEGRLAAFTDLAATAIANTQARGELGRLAAEQAALRRVATLVARDEPPEAVFAVVAYETGRLFAADATGVVRYDSGGAFTSVGSWNSAGPSTEGTTAALGGHNVSTLVFETGRPARIDRYAAADSGEVTSIARGAGLRSAIGVPLFVENRLWGSLQVASSREAGLPPGTEERLADFAELAAIAIANAQTRADLLEAAAEQAALRRVATLVAQAAPPSVVFAGVAEEVGRLLSAERAYVERYVGRTVTKVAAWSASGERVRDGDLRPFGAGSASALVSETGDPARPAPRPDHVPETAPGLGLRSGVAAPITVGGRLWGVIGVDTTGEEPLRPGTEMRLAEFTEILATAIANANAQAELTASRARIVAGADEARRRIERDLHDGAQQRLVTLALQVRAAQAAVPPDLDEIAAELDRVASGLTDALEELRDFARGIHPAILAEGGLGPALKTLARRSAIPVQLRVATAADLPEAVELAAYYVVSEAVTDAAKHGTASSVTVEVEATDGVLRIVVRDDGAASARGSVLTDLRDRVEALGGRISVERPRSAQTLVQVRLPLADGSAGLD